MLLNYHLNDNSKVDKIIKTLLEERCSHDYIVGRKEAKNEVGLNSIYCLNPFPKATRNGRIFRRRTLRGNGIVVPLAGAGGKLKSTISSPIQVHGVTKVPAKRAPELGEHDEEILKELGFDAKEIDGFRTSGTLGKPKGPAKGT
jgi:hypothetical protein